MRVGRELGAVAFLVLGLGAAGARANWVPIPIPNGSFETPHVNDPNNPYAIADASVAIDDWQKGPSPALPVNPTLFGGLLDSTDKEVGTFANTGGITNMDGNQCAYVFAVPNLELYQDLTATYQTGQAYQLRVGVIAPAYGGGDLEMRLYYRDGTNNRVTIGTQNINFSNVNDHGGSQFDTFTLDIPTVGADAWADHKIGVQFFATTPGGGYWELDNAQLATTPTPSAVWAGLALLGGVLGVRSVRRWRRA